MRANYAYNKEVALNLEKTAFHIRQKQRMAHLRMLADNRQKSADNTSYLERVHVDFLLNFQEQSGCEAATD